VGILIAVIAVVVLVIAVTLTMRARTRAATERAAAPKPMVEPEPMIGLESALDQATDRAGRNMRQRLESVSGLDDLRITDDTGPVLRRALDHVAPASPTAAVAPVDTGA
jgi:hypothetical protein